MEELELVGLCVVGIVFNGEDFLFLKRVSDVDVWCPPCGKVRKGEDLCDALMREVYEESGLFVEMKSIVSTWQGNISSSNGRVLSVSYLCRSSSRDVVLSEEHTDYKWVHYSKLSEINTEFDTSNWPSYITD